MEEGPTLDFKREQYRFNGATDQDKSKLLKDILAFTNSQRYRTAYILVGVEEGKGGRSEVVGVQDHLDDAKTAPVCQQQDQQASGLQLLSVPG